MAALRMLNLSHQRGLTRLQGTLPDHITRLNELTGIYIQQNQFTGALPLEIWRLTSLEFLQAQGNELSGPIPHGIGFLSKLRSLQLNHNRIGGTLPDTFATMEYLHELLLDNNLISGSVPEALGHLPRLRLLSAEDNRISGSLPDSIGSLQYIDQLLFKQNRIAGPLPPTLGKLSSLHVLDLSHNNLTHSLPEELGELSSLVHLMLNDNFPGLNASIPEALGGLASVQNLRLANNGFNGHPPDFLKRGFQEQRTVTLSGNPYYCPLQEWALLNYSSIHCLHCPGEDPRTGPNGSLPDYTSTCSNHGICIDGSYCQCEPAWDGFSTDCSQLACPTTEEVQDDGSVVQSFCSGNGECYNTRVASVSCPGGNPSAVNPSDYLPALEQSDYVAYAVDCVAGEIVFARCQCINFNFASPKCELISVATAEDQIIESGVSTRTMRSSLVALVIVAVTLVQASGFCTRS